MSDVNLAAIASTVVWSTFALGAVFGAVAHRTNFCTMGAISDIVNFGDWSRMRMWLLAIAVAVVATHAMAAAGVIDTAKAITTQPKLIWLSHMTGGTLFGFGMVLASGCGSKALVRIGSGSLKALVVFVVLGLFAYMTLKGVFGVLRVATVDAVGPTLATPQDIASLLGGGPAVRIAVGLVAGIALAAFVFAKRDFRTTENIVGGLVIGAVVAAGWFVSGQLGYVAEDPATLQEAFVATNSQRMESFSFVAPLAYSLELLMFWSDKSKAVTMGIAGTLGMIVGAAVSAIATRTFRWEGFRDTEDTANHLVGAALMGVGGITALGCTVGQGLSGMSTLALGSIVTTGAIMAGGVLGVKYQAWRQDSIAT